MSERYTKLLSLPENLYTKGSPVVVSAGNLLKDTQTGKVLAQIKYTNITHKVIKAIQVRLFPVDTTGQPLGEELSHEYLDLSADFNGSFGAKEAIPFTNSSTRGFSIDVSKVVFQDNSVWESGGSPWEALPAPETLESALGDEETAKEYRIQYGETCRYLPRKVKDIWQCSCGAINQSTADTCGACGCRLATLLSFKKEELNGKKDARVAAEQQEKRAKEKKRKIKITALIATVLVAIVLALVLMPVMYKNKIPDVVKVIETGYFTGYISEDCDFDIFFGKGQVCVHKRIWSLDKIIDSLYYNSSDDNWTPCPSYEIKSDGFGTYTISWTHLGVNSEVKIKYSDVMKISRAQKSRDYVHDVLTGYVEGCKFDHFTYATVGWGSPNF